MNKKKNVNEISADKLQFNENCKYTFEYKQNKNFVKYLINNEILNKNLF